MASKFELRFKDVATYDAEIAHKEWDDLSPSKEEIRRYLNRASCSCKCCDH